MDLVKIKDFPNYSFDKNSNQVYNIKLNRYITPHKHRKVFYMDLSKNNKITPINLNKIVYESYYGEIPNGMRILHIDNNTLNNNIENLKLVPIVREGMNLIPINDYKDLYSYDLNTDKIYSHISNKYIKLKLEKYGYYRFGINKDKKTKNYLYHRFVYQYHNLDKDISNCIIDHIDRNPLNNDINNLRMATRSQNNINTKIKKNNTTGHTNIYSRRPNHFCVEISMNKKKHSKTFKTLEEAIEYRNIKKKEIQGEFSNIN
tara:strand:+ start:40 stop:819 length:780 start_codon:yes stop_codon:yes gene_type:complete